MLHQNSPSDARIVDEVFNVVAKPGLEEVGWLLGMVAVYGKTPEELEGFTWNEDNSINLKSKKRAIRPLHPQWVFIFQLKEKQPFNAKGRWGSLLKSLEKAKTEQRIGLTIKNLLLAHRVRKVYYTPLRLQKQYPDSALVSA